MRAGRTTPQRRRAHQDEPSRARAGAQGVQGHGRALRRLRLRPGRRPGRGGADGALFHGRAWCAASTRRPSCPACSWRARMPAARTAPTGSAATASPTPRCSAASPGRRWRPGSRANPGPARARRGCAAAPRWRARSMPFARKAGDLNGLRERLLDAMWDDVGVIRDAAGLQRGLDKLDAIEAELLSIGVADGDRAFNLTWHDWLNLRSLVEISKVITLAALQAREQPRRPLPRGLPRRRRPRHLDLHRGAAARRAPRHRRRAGAVHHRQAGRDAAREGGRGVIACRGRRLRLLALVAALDG